MIFLLILIFMLFLIGFYLVYTRTTNKVHPAGYIMVSKRDLRRFAQGSDDDDEYWDDDWDYGFTPYYNEAQQYQRTLLESQNNMIADMNTYHLREQADFETRRAWQDINRANDSVVGGIGRLFNLGD